MSWAQRENLTPRHSSPHKKVSDMQQSHVITIDGAFVGAALRLEAGYRFIAVDIRMDDLDGTVWPSLADVQRLAHRLYRTGRLDAPPGLSAAASGEPSQRTQWPVAPPAAGNA